MRHLRKKEKHPNKKCSIKRTQLRVTYKPYHTPNDMYLINPPLVTA
jgi:hypothetical protein